MRQKGIAAAGIGTADRQPDQFGPQPPDLPEVPVHRQPRAPPEAGAFLVDAHGADHLVGLMGIGRQGDQMRRNKVDLVAVMGPENPLFLDKDAATQRLGPPRLEGFRGGADVVTGALELTWFKLDHAGTFSFS